MRVTDNHWHATINKELFQVNFHHFIELEEKYNCLEVAEELGISIGEVRLMKKKINRT